jgi:hypothetical protein
MMQEGCHFSMRVGAQDGIKCDYAFADLQRLFPWTPLRKAI